MNQLINGIYKMYKVSKNLQMINGDLNHLQ